MRWLIAFILIALLVWKLWPEPEPLPIEETFIAEPVQRLQDAKDFEQEYLDATEARKAEMEKKLEEADGG